MSFVIAAGIVLMYSLTHCVGHDSWPETQVMSEKANNLWKNVN